MSLPSQARRSGGPARSNIYRKRKRNPIRTIIIGAVIISAGATAAFWRPWANTQATEPTENIGQAAPDRLLGTDTSTDTTTSKPVNNDPEPEHLTMSPELIPEANTQKPPTTPRQAQGQPANATPTNIQPAIRPAVSPTNTGGRPLSQIDSLLVTAENQQRANRPVEARVLLNRALNHSAATEPDRRSIRSKLMGINEELVFSPRINEADPLSERYTIQSGDSLQRIASRQGLAIDWRLLQRVNRLANPSMIRAGASLKLVRGPFHAVVNKSDYRLDIYAGAPDDQSNWMYIRSFAVGLGEGNGTPPGTYVVRADSKLINPFWRNPRTGEQFGADDPKNPIGEHWLGLQGLGEASTHTGYGLHGTIEPNSIGQQRSMGCVRMRPEDIAVVYEMLVEGISVVRIE